MRCSPCLQCYYMRPWGSLCHSLEDLAPVKHLSAGGMRDSAHPEDPG